MEITTKNEIVNKYKSGYSLKRLASEYPQCVRTIKKIILDSGNKIEFRDNGRRKHKLNEKYFEFIDSPAKAYYLGFLFADGYVLADGYVSGMTLAITDREVLEGLSREVYGSDEPVYDIKKMQTNKIPQSRIIFKSKEFQKHLLDKNLIHNKSLVLAPPLGVPENLIKYFIHGYFDGDGCFCKPNWQIVSTRPFCQWVADFLIKNNLISNYNIRAVKDKGTCRLMIHRVADVLNLFNYFYMENPSPVFLNRKREKIFNYLSERDFSHFNLLGDKASLSKGIIS